MTTTTTKRAKNNSQTTRNKISSNFSSQGLKKWSSRTYEFVNLILDTGVSTSTGGT